MYWSAAQVPPGHVGCDGPQLASPPTKLLRAPSILCFAALTARPGLLPLTPPLLLLLSPCRRCLGASTNVDARWEEPWLDVPVDRTLPQLYEGNPHDGGRVFANVAELRTAKALHLLNISTWQQQQQHQAQVVRQADGIKAAPLHPTGGFEVVRLEDVAAGADGVAWLRRLVETYGLEPSEAAATALLPVDLWDGGGGSSNSGRGAPSQSAVSMADRIARPFDWVFTPQQQRRGAATSSTAAAGGSSGGSGTAAAGTPKDPQHAALIAKVDKLLHPEVERLMGYASPLEA